jgi:uncharacterized protein YciI
MKPLQLAACLLGLLAAVSTPAQDAPRYDAERAQAWGANAQGLRPYVFVLLKTGPKRMPDGPARDAMFKGHFANMARLAREGVLVYAGPLDGVDGWRGLFILTSPDLETARRHVETDPVIAEGEMVAELHRHFGSAALMGVTEQHGRLIKPNP